MSFKICFAALTLSASVAAGENMKLAQLLSLQQHLVEHFEEGQAEYGHAHFNDLAPLYDEPAPLDGECPLGFTRVGCCKCVHNKNAQSAHLGGALPGEEDERPVLHSALDAEKHHKVVPAKPASPEDATKDEPKQAPEKKSKLTMSTTEEQAKRKMHPKPAPAAAKAEEKTPEPVAPPQPVVTYDCPKGFTFEARGKHSNDACRMPMSYDLGAGVDHHCLSCQYSYGRWLETCEENFVRNGCCTCTPHCPEGMVMDYWEQNDIAKNNYVCLIRASSY